MESVIYRVKGTNAKAVGSREWSLRILGREGRLSQMQRTLAAPGRDRGKKHPHVTTSLL
jgi:hypothetical protein